MIHAALCKNSRVCAVQRAVARLDEPRENLERELFYAWKQVEQYERFGLIAESDNWLGVVQEVEEALVFIYIARQRWLDSLPDVLLACVP